MTAARRRNLRPGRAFRTLPVWAAVLALVCTGAPAGAATIVKLRGGGWGHGIGMSQYGAYGRALNGRSAADILKHYYSGAAVRRRTMPERVRVGLLQYRKSIAVESWAYELTGGRITWRVRGTDRRLAAGDPDDRFKVARAGDGAMRLYRNGELVERSGDSKFGGPDHPLVAIYERHGSAVRVLPKDNSYAYGRMEFGTFPSTACDGSYCLRLVVSLGMQEYLYGLAEMPSSWPGAALRSQAIAGRTYAFEKIRRLGQHRAVCDCALYDSVIDQAYAGDAKRTGSGLYWKDWKGAVDGTARKVVVHEGSPIQALYMSSSGGHTEHNENVWGGTPLPYLRGVRDRADDVDSNPNHTWTVKMRWRELSEEIDAAYGTGKLEKFKVVDPLGVSGRVTIVTADGGGVKMVGADETVRASGWSVRSALGLKDTLFRVTIDYDTAATFVPAYEALEGAPGEPVGVAYDVPRRSATAAGRAQDFERGRMTVGAGGGPAVWQYGPVLRAYDAAGREGGALGMPLTGVRTTRGLSWARYAGGLIVEGRKGAAHAILADMARPYRRSGGVAGPLGAPLEDPVEISGARLQRFEGGVLFRGRPGARAVALTGERLRRRLHRIGL